MNNKRLLYNLCLVNRKFNYVFSKRLWRCLELNDINMHCFTDKGKRAVLLQTSNLQYTRILIHTMAPKDDESLLFPQWTAELADLLQQLPRLDSIVCVGTSLRGWPELMDLVQSGRAGRV